MPVSFSLRQTGNRRRPDRASQLAALRRLVGHALRGLGWTALTCAAAALVLYGGREAYRYLTTSPTFAIEAIEVIGDVAPSGGHGGRLDVEHVRAASGLVLGENLFRTSVRDARARLEQNPWVRAASVERKLPRRIVVRVEQRQPIAYAEFSGLYLIDERGQVFKRASAEDDLDLPTITGLSRRDFISGKPDLHEQVALALSFIAPAAGAQLPWEPGELSEIHFDDDLGMTLELGALPTAVELGFPPFADKLERLRRARSQLAQRQLRASALYLEDSRQPDHVGMALAGPTP